MKNESHLNTTRASVKAIERLFGSPGLIALSYWLGASLVSEVKRELGFFPVLNLAGQRGSGRSTLCEILHNLNQKFDYEGLSTKLTEAALFHQATKKINLPLVLLDPNVEDEKIPNLIKCFFNGYQYTRAPILSSESPIELSLAVEARTVRVNLERSKEPASRLSVEPLLHLAMSAPYFPLEHDDLRCFFFKNTMDQFNFYSKKIKCRSFRVNQNYALLAAMTGSLGLVFGLSTTSIEKAIRLIIKTAKAFDI